ncbi:hypothetical protein [Candidatus Harpocratesius sp.]
MKFSFARYLIGIGILLLIITVGALTIFREGYLRLEDQIDSSAQYLDDPTIYSIKKKGDMLFIVEGSMGLEILNISSYDQPKKISHFSYDRGFNFLTVNDTFLYLINDLNQIVILNASNPKNPEYITTYSPLFTSFDRIYISGKNGIAFTDKGTIVIIDFSDFSSITEYNFLKTNEKFDEIAILNNLLIGLKKDAGISIFNMSSFESVQKLSEINASISNFKEIIGIPKQNLLCVHLDTNFLIYDLTEPINPQIILNISDSDESPVFSQIQATSTKIFFVNQSDGGIWSANITDLLSGKEKSFYRFYAHIPIEKNHIKLFENLLIFFNPKELNIDLISFDANFPFNFQYHNSIYLGFGQVNDVIVSNSLVFYSEGNKGIKIANFSENKPLNEIANFSNLGYYTRIFHYQNYIFAQNSLNTLELIDISNTSHPILKRTLTIPADQITDLVFFQSWAFFSTGYDGIFIYNLSNPESPQLWGNISTIGAIFDLEIDNNYLFAAAGDLGIKIFEIKNISNISQIAVYIDNICKKGVTNLLLANNNIFAYGTFSGVVIIGVDHPINPVYLNYYNPEYGYVSCLSVEKGSAYIGYETGYVEFANITMINDIYSIKVFKTKDMVSSIYILPDYIIVANNYHGLLFLRRSFTYSPSLIGSIIISITFSLGMIMMAIGMFILYRTRDLRYKLDELMKNYRYTLHGIPRERLLEVCRIIIPFLEKFDFTKYSTDIILEIDQIIQEGFIEEENNPRLNEKLDELFHYYENSTLLLASQICQGKNLSEKEMERILHEGSFQERQILENVLPSHHFLIYGLNRKLKITNREGFDIFR